MRQLVSYAIGNSKALSDCHSVPGACKAVFYFDSGQEIEPSTGCLYSPDQDIVKAASESWFVHDTGYTDSSHRVYGKFPNGCTAYEMNPSSSGLQNWFRSYLQTTAAAYDAYFSDSAPMDIADSGWFPSRGGCDPWPHICTSTQEIPNNTAEVAARVSFMNALTYSNGSSMHAVYQQADLSDSLLDFTALAATHGFIGVTCEGCVANFAASVQPALYAPVLNEMAVIDASNGSFVLISQGDFPPGSSSEMLQRLVTTGIIWLGYSEGHTMVWPDLEKGTNNLGIWPEDLIYPSNPVESMTSGASDLQVTSGVWRREFATCYQAGRSFGRCAALLNSTGSSVTVQSAWLSQSYHHVITLSGGDVISGGTATVNSTSFVPNVTTVPAESALLLAQ